MTCRFLLPISGKRGVPRSESKRSFWWKMEVDDPGVIIAPVGMINCTQTEEQVDAGSNVSKNVQRM